MDTTRQQKIGRLLQKELGDMFQKETKDTMRGIIISVTVVRVTSDLGLAKVYLSIFPTNNTEELLKGIKANTKRIRHDLGKRIRHQVRVVPELAFFIDDSMDYANRIDELLK